MEQKIVAIAVAASALIAVGAQAHAAPLAEPAGLYHQAAAVIAPLGTEPGDQREVIAPPSDVDPQMTIRPPSSSARMPVIAPPELPGGRFGIER